MISRRITDEHNRYRRPPRATPGIALFPLLVMSAAMGASLTGLYMINGLQEAVKHELRLSDFQQSLVLGVAVAIPLSLASIPVGLLIDRVNRMRVMVVMSVLWVVAALGTAFADTLPLLFGMRILAATAGAAMLTTSISLAADFSAPDERGRAMLIVNLAKIVFSAAALPAGAWLVLAIARVPIPDWVAGLPPWRGAHVGLAAIGVGFTAMLCMIREPARREVGAGPQAPFRVVLGEVWTRRAYLGPLIFGQVGVLMADAAATIWATPILSRNFHLDTLQFAGWLGGAGLLAGIAGTLIGGYGADLGLKNRRGGVMLAGVIAAAIAVPAAFFPILPTPALVIGALTLLLLCGTIASMALLAVIGAYLPNETRGLVVGIFLAVGGLIGFGVAPTLVIGVSALLGGERYMAPALTLVGVIVSIFALACFVLAMARIPAPPTRKT